MVDGIVTTYPLEIVETTSSPVERLFFDAADNIVNTSSPPAGYSQWTWITNTYGSAGPWLTAVELEQWKLDRSPSRQIVVMHLMSTRDIPVYLEQLSNAVPTAPEGGENISLLVLYSNDIAFVALSPSPMPNGLLHSPTNVTKLDVFTTTNLLAPRGGWVLLASMDRTGDPLYVPLGSLDGFMSVAAGNAILDTDGDTIADARENMIYGSDPYASDSDYDGVSDRDEIFRYGTNPFNADSDGDGYADGLEIAAWTNPRNSDTDGDGLTDYEEIFVYFTDPLDYDTDFDGLTDGEEILLYFTYPVHEDTDDDGLDDYEEVIELGTNPHSADSDSDGMSDYREDYYGFDPNDPSDAAGDYDGDGLSNLMEFQWMLYPTSSNGMASFQEIITCSAGSNSVRRNGNPNSVLALGDCGANSAYVRIRPFMDNNALVGQKLFHSQTPGIFINGQGATTVASPIEIAAQSVAEQFTVTATKAAKGTNIWFRLTNDVHEGVANSFARFYVPKTEWIKFRAPLSSTTVVYDATGTLSVVFSSATNACRIYVQAHGEPNSIGYADGIFSDWIRVRVSGPGANPTNTTDNSYDYRAAYASSYSYPFGHGIKLTAPGVHKIEAGFDMNANAILDDDEVEETCIINALQVSVEWEAINSPLDDNPNWGGGFRMFPDKQSPTDTVDRTKVRLRATVSPAVSNVAVYFKVFDVDDPTPPSFDAARVIDSDWVAGDDNYGTPKTGSLSTNKAMTDANGQAFVDLTVTLKAGDNFRAAATTISAELLKLTVANAASALFVAPTNKPVAGFAGGLTDMLTIWRKLHLEIDSMEEVAVSGSEKNYDEGTLWQCDADSPAAGQSTLHLYGGSDGAGNRYANGHIVISNAGSYFVRSSSAEALGLGVIVDGTVSTSAVNQTYQLYDDDDWQLDVIELAPALPKNNWHADIIAAMQTNYSSAYIAIWDANANGANATQTIPFVRNAPSVSSPATTIFDDSLELGALDGSNYWAFTLCIAYQSGTSDDIDPDPPAEGPTLGETPEGGLYVGMVANKPWGFSVVYVETLRDYAIGPYTILSSFVAQERQRYLNLFYGVCAHEVGHAPGRQGDDDHNEGGLMDGDPKPITYLFSPATIKRFRSATSWRN